MSSPYIQSETSSNVKSLSQNKSAVTSIRSDCLQNLRFPQDKDCEKKKTHLLAYMAEFIEDKTEVKIQEVDEFCSYDRIKKIIEKKREAESCEKIIDQGKDFFGKEEITDEMFGAIHLQVKMKKMEKSLNKPNTRPATALMQHNNQMGINLKKRNLSTKFSSSVLQKSFDKGNTKQNITPSEFLLTSQVQACSQKKPKETITHTASYHLLGRHTIKKQFLDTAYEDFTKWQKKKKLDNENSVKKFIEEEIQKKVHALIEERDIKYNQLVKLNKEKQEIILRQKLEIQNLKAKSEALLERNKKLDVYRERYSIETSKQTKQNQLFLQKFYEEFIQNFPNESVVSLKKQMSNIVDKCLGKFENIQGKNHQKWGHEKKDLNEEIERLQNVIKRLKNTEMELRNNLKNMKYEQASSNLEIDGLLNSKQELEKLQNKILSIYNQWYSRRNEQEKQVMQNLGLMKGSYQYIQMLDYIVVYREKLSTDHKVYEYLIKVLRGIEKIRKTMFPRTDFLSNQGNSKKKDPLLFLEQLEKYIKVKVFQTKYKKGQVKNVRMSQLIEQEFFQAGPLDEISED